MDKKNSFQSIDILSVFQDGFKLFQKNITIALILGLISAIVSYIFASWETGVRGGALGLLPIFRAAITVSISAILILYLYSTEKNKNAPISNSISKFFDKYILITMLTALALAAVIIGGLIFFVIPGILFVIWFSQTYYFLLLENKTPVEAMKASKALTYGRRLAILVVFIVQVVINGFVSGVVGKILPDAVSAVTAIFPGTYFWFVGYVLYKKLKKE